MPAAGIYVPSELNDLAVDVALAEAPASIPQGALLFRGATKWNRLAPPSGSPGTGAGQLLVTGGASANPSWTDTLPIQLRLGHLGVDTDGPGRWALRVQPNGTLKSYSGALGVFLNNSATLPVFAVAHNGQVAIGGADPQTRLDVTGDTALTTVATLPLVYLRRSADPGVAKVQIASFDLGRWASDGTQAPNTRLDIRLKHVNDSGVVPDTTVMTFQSDGKVLLPTGPLVMAFNKAVQGIRSDGTAIYDLVKVGSGNNVIVGSTVQNSDLQGNSSISFTTGNGTLWQLTAVSLAPLTDNARDLGSSSNRVKTVYAIQAALRAAAASGLPLIVEGTTSQTGKLLTFRGRSSTTAGRDMAVLDAVWATNTDATRQGRLVAYASDWNGDREGFRVEADGTNPRIGFLGVTAKARPSAYSLTGSATRTMPTDPSTTYIGIDNAQGGTVYAQLTDLNALRSAVSGLTGVVRQLLTDLGHTSGFGLLNA